MTIDEAAAIATTVIEAIAALVKSEPPTTAADLLARIKADESDLASGLAADDAAAQDALHKKFDTP